MLDPMPFVVSHNLRTEEFHQHPNRDSFFVGPAPLQKCVGDFCCVTYGGFCRGFSWFWALFPTKLRRKNPATKSAKKSGGRKIKNPRKIRSAKTDPYLLQGRCIHGFCREESPEHILGRCERVLHFTGREVKGR